MRSANRTIHKGRYQSLRAQIRKAARVAAAKRHHRARTDIAFRIEKKLDKAVACNASRFQINCAQMSPYVQQFGKHAVTVWIGESLPPYFGLRAKSTRAGDAFNGWVITRIG